MSENIVKQTLWNVFSHTVDILILWSVFLNVCFILYASIVLLRLGVVINDSHTYLLTYFVPSGPIRRSETNTITSRSLCYSRHRLRRIGRREIWRDVTWVERT